MDGLTLFSMRGNAGLEIDANHTCATVQANFIRLLRNDASPPDVTDIPVQFVREG